MVTLGCSSGRVAQGFWSTGDDPALGEGCMEMIGWWRLFRLDARVSCTFMYVPPASTTRVKRIPGNTFASVTEGSEVPFKSSHPPPHSEYWTPVTLQQCWLNVGKSFLSKSPTDRLSFLCGGSFILLVAEPTVPCSGPGLGRPTSRLCELLGWVKACSG